MFSFYFLILLNAIYKDARIPMSTASLEGKYVRLIGTNTKKGDCKPNARLPPVEHVYKY